ncbi:biotin transporter BioY [Methanolobus sp. ZRKC3]|uniref:biotin transporter BioY n=1 Tax=Methanolobus sp. ZRKC3 TaxID=3125786 RepID=UPI003249D085
MDELASYNGDIRKMAYASLFAAMIAVGAYIRIPLPFSPVPITLQVLFVLLAGAMLGARWGTLSVVVYLLLGIAGLPVFSGGSSGIGVVLGPTGGYLIGFLVAAFLIGAMSQRNGISRPLYNVLYMLAGTFIIFLFGASYLMHSAQLTFSEGMALGVIPFIPGGIIKIALASLIASRYSLKEHNDTN